MGTPQQPNEDGIFNNFNLPKRNIPVVKPATSCHSNNSEFLQLDSRLKLYQEFEPCYSHAH